MQIGHAGRKGSTRLAWDGIDLPLDEGNWPLISASPLPYIDGVSQTPREMTRADMGRVKVADAWSDKLGVPLAIIHKRRDPKVHNDVSVHEIVGDVEGRVCLLVDDLIDTGRTIVKAAEALKDAGATGVIVAATHAVFSDPAYEILQSDCISQVVVTDTLPIPDDKRWDRLTVLPIAPLLARAIHEVFDDGSVTSMFDGAA